MNSLHYLEHRLPLLFLLIALNLAGCSEPVFYPVRELTDQILVPRHGYENKLTHQTCGQYANGLCVASKFVEYDLTAKEFREQLSRLGFVCKFGDKEYKVCVDQAGFCRTTYSRNFLQKLFGGGTKQVEFLPATPVQALIDGRLRCFSPAYYDWDTIH